MATNDKNGNNQDLHWNLKLPRNGPLADNLTHTTHSTFFVSNLQQSVDFYSKIMKFDLLEIVEGISAVFDAKNLLLELKVGNPIVFSAENLIVGHVSVDVPDTKEAFDYLTQEKVPFEINVSVPKGVGKAMSEGGSTDNSVGQAFIRDPDGYYLEICNCHLLTDFILGLTGDHDLLHGYEEGTKNVAKTFFASSMMKLIARRSRRRLGNPKSTSSSVILQDRKEAKVADPTILNNFIKRTAIYGDICQSFTPKQMEQILCNVGNSAPNAILRMKELIKSKKATKVYQPPAYYVGKIDDCTVYEPQVFIAGRDEKGRHMTAAPKWSAGLLAKATAKCSLTSNNEEKKADNGYIPQKSKKIDFTIVSVNHIALIVSDVGRSSYFYSDILGLQQVKRPNFDRHGAWFTGGNVEYHLILGNPLAPERTAKSSESNTNWFSVKDLGAAKEKLSDLSLSEKENIQLEIFETKVYLRDPDGYLFGIVGEEEKQEGTRNNKEA